VSRNDHAVHRQAPPGPDDDDVARGDLRCTHFACRVPPAHECLVRQEIEQVLDRASPAPDGGGRMRVVATIEDPVVIRRMLTHLGLPTAAPAPRPPPSDLFDWS
jgi:hypothetical protein